jgi:hypothetical protein
MIIRLASPFNYYIHFEVIRDSSKLIAWLKTILMSCSRTILSFAPISMSCNIHHFLTDLKIKINQSYLFIVLKQPVRFKINVR